jgi:hypothetical protein
MTPCYLYIMINEWFIHKWHEDIKDDAIEEVLID